MSRDKNYQRLLNSPRWREVKTQVWRRANGLCELCKAEGFITAGVDVHHIRPVEQAKTVEGPDGMRARCYNPANCQLLCVPCHIKVHQAMRTHTKEKVRENKERARQRFLEANDPHYKEDHDRASKTEAKGDDEVLHHLS